MDVIPASSVTGDTIYGYTGHGVSHDDVSEEIVEGKEQLLGFYRECVCQLGNGLTITHHISINVINSEAGGPGDLLVQNGATKQGALSKLQWQDAIYKYSSKRIRQRGQPEDLEKLGYSDSTTANDAAEGLTNEIDPLFCFRHSSPTAPRLLRNGLGPWQQWRVEIEAASLDQCSMLGLALPSIDANDLDKTLYTLSYIQSVCHSVPFHELTRGSDDISGSMLAMEWVASEVAQMEEEGVQVKCDYPESLSDDEGMILRASTAGVSRALAGDGQCVPAGAERR